MIFGWDSSLIRLRSMGNVYGSITIQCKIFILGPKSKGAQSYKHSTLSPKQGGTSTRGPCVRGSFQHAQTQRMFLAQEAHGLVSPCGQPTALRSCCRTVWTSFPKVSAPELL